MTEFFSRLASFPHAVLSVINQYLLLLELISIIFSAVFIWGIIYSIIGADYINIQLDKLSDTLGIRHLPKRRAIRAWRKIEKRVRLGTETQLKLAMLEADKIFDEILKLSGFVGETMDDRLAQATEAQISNLDTLTEAHYIAKKISQDPEFTLDEDAAHALLKEYEALFSEFGLV